MDDFKGPCPENGSGAETADGGGEISESGSQTHFLNTRAVSVLKFGDKASDFSRFASMGFDDHHSIEFLFEVSEEDVHLLANDLICGSDLSHEETEVQAIKWYKNQYNQCQSPVA